MYKFNFFQFSIVLINCALVVQANSIGENYGATLIRRENTGYTTWSEAEDEKKVDWVDDFR